jgi:hypothetical protein
MPKRPKTTEALRLSWPDIDIPNLLIYMDNQTQVVYGAGRYEEAKYIICSRTGGKTPVNHSFLTVPGIYGQHLERLVYNFRFYVLAWKHCMDSFFDGKNGRFPAKYKTAVTVLGQMGKYHGDALRETVDSLRNMASTCNAFLDPDRWVELKQCLPMVSTTNFSPPDSSAANNEDALDTHQAESYMSNYINFDEGEGVASNNEGKAAMNLLKDASEETMTQGTV